MSCCRVVSPYILPTQYGLLASCSLSTTPSILLTPYVLSTHRASYWQPYALCWTRHLVTDVQHLTMHWGHWWDRQAVLQGPRSGVEQSGVRFVAERPGCFTAAVRPPILTVWCGCQGRPTIPTVWRGCQGQSSSVCTSTASSWPVRFRLIAFYPRASMRAVILAG